VDYSRTHNLFQTLTSSNNRINDNIEGFGHRWTDPGEKIGNYYNSDATNGKYNTDGINPGHSKRVNFKLLSGIFSQYKYIPLQFCPIVIELELDQNQFANIIKADGNLFTDDTVSKLFTIDDVVVYGDVITLDNSLNNSYIEALMSGTALTVPFTSFVSQSHIMSQTQQFNVNIIRSFTRLKSMFISFNADAPLTSIANPITHDPPYHPLFLSGLTDISGSGDTIE